MNELGPRSPERDPRVDDAERLTVLLYYAYDRENKTDEHEIREVIADVESYIKFRADQDQEMGHALVAALEGFRDPDPTLATLEAAQNMQQQANRVREVLGLPARALPTEPHTPDDYRPAP